MKKEDISTLTTEGRKPRSAQIDQVSILEMLQIINQEDQTVALAVEKELLQIAQAVGYFRRERMPADFRYAARAGGRTDCGR